MVCATLPSPLLANCFDSTKWHSLFQHVVENDQHQVRDRDYGSLLSSSRCDLMESCFEHRALLAGRRPGALDEHCPQIGVAMRGVTAPLNTRTFPVTRA